MSRYSAAYFCRTASELLGIYLWGLTATIAEEPIFVYMVSVMNRSRMHATMMSSDTEGRVARSVTDSKRWCMPSVDCRTD